MSDEYPELREAVAEAAFAALETAAEAGVWAAIALYPDHPLHVNDMHTPTTPVEAAQRVVALAEALIDALQRYRALCDEQVDESLPF